MSKTKEYFLSRRFLNKRGHHSVGAIHASVTGSKHGSWSSIDGEVTIADCRHTITIDMYAGSEAEFKNSMYKLNIMIEVMTNLRDAMLEAKEDIGDLK